MNTATALVPGIVESAAPSPTSSVPTKIFTPLVSQFLEYLKLERHFSDYTVKSYGADLQQFGQYLAGEIGRPIGAVIPEKIMHFEQVEPAATRSSASR